MKVLVLVLLGGCIGDLVEPWQLDHDRIVAVRATPPAIPGGGASQIDVLVSSDGTGAVTLAPEAIEVLSPPSLVSAVTGDTVTAPSDLTSARTELALAADAPVPLVLSVFANGFSATKTVWLGETADNPPLTGLQIGGNDPGADLVLAADTNVPLAVTADDSIDNVTWLTSCGTMHDFDLSRAYIRIAPDDPQAGQLALVLRDPSGGVSWRVWPLRTE